MSEDLAAIEYGGVAGASRECMNAVLRLLQYGDDIRHVRILSSGGTHCILLTVNVGEDLVAVKSGFRSGYGGEGPRTFSQVLGLLLAFKLEIDEYDVPREVIDRLDNSALTSSDVAKIESCRAVRPSRWYDYVYEEDWRGATNRALWTAFPPVMPFAIIDDRIIDLAITFWEQPDQKLLTGYRRLEDLVRKRTDSVEHGTKLFTGAFVGQNSKLYWKEIDSGEHTGRGLLFTAAWQTQRNPRAHRELDDDAENELSEFLILNRLFLLERKAIERPSGDEAQLKSK